MRWLKTLTGTVLLATGGLIYLAVRPRQTLLIIVAENIGLKQWVDGLRLTATHINIPKWVAESLPGALWSAAYILLMDAIVQNNSRKNRLAWCSVVPLMGVGSELMQWAGLLPGTPDATDLILYALPYMLYTGILLSKKTKKYV